MVATVAIAGCAGNGGGGGGGGGGGPVRSSVNPSVLNKPGNITVTYDTGQGRAPGSQTAVIRRFFMEDVVGLVETQLRSEMRLQLDAYTSQSLELNPTMGGYSVPIASRLFTVFPLEILAMIVEQFDGSLVRYSGPANAPIFRDDFAVRCRAFPGRRSSVQIFLDDATLFYDEVGQQVVFDRPRFESINYDLIDQRINGFLSDYVMFDITNVANKPQLTTGPDATRVYFSGDAIALSVDPVPGGADMEVLTPLAPPIEALVSPPQSFPIQSDGTYTLRQIDPRDLQNIARITALQGIWRPYHDPNDVSRSLILNPGAFEFFALPNSDDNEKQEIVLIARDLAGDITDMYFGELDYSTLSFAAWPIENVDTGAATGEINGTLSGIVYRAGVPNPTYRDIRSGTFTITLGTIPATFQTTGSFLVIRL